MNTVAEIEKINQKHQLNLTEKDVHIFDNTIYISSQKAALLLHATFQAFSNYYVKPLVGKGGVARIILGKTRWYCLSDLERVIQTAIEKKKSIFEVCKS